MRIDFLLRDLSIFLNNFKNFCEFTMWNTFIGISHEYHLGHRVTWISLVTCIRVLLCRKWAIPENIPHLKLISQLGILTCLTQAGIISKAAADFEPYITRKSGTRELNAQRLPADPITLPKTGNWLMRIRQRLALQEVEVIQKKLRTEQAGD